MKCLCFVGQRLMTDLYSAETKVIKKQAYVAREVEANRNYKR